ncbi:hypothetical protein L6164_037407 [Bauhinia variegata]|uniref:Uncharacterized protein n=1 Tax=Bauhinia variegata TaxID=167791 RepID=A0ACB9KJT0_BAUVA|nr:hypothetical protein L6164_037407 [Bauhinia variegata]
MNEIVDLSKNEKMDNGDTIGKVQFHNLRSLKLNDLPVLSSFCYDETRFPTMSHETSETLFNDKVVFPNLNSLKISSINFQKIWQDSPSTYFWIKSMTNLTVEGCRSLQNIISTVQGMCLVNLKHLEIRRCEKVEQILFKPEEVKDKEALDHIGAPFSEEVIFPNLETLILSHMDSLQKIWPKHCAPNSFNKLKGVEFNYCQKLVTVFPSYMLRSLSHVERVRVTDCGSVETIFDLQEDGAFQLETQNFPATGDQLVQLDAVIKQPLFSVEKVIPNLEVLALSGMEANKIWKEQFREDLFHNIKKLCLQKFENKVAAFPYWFLHKMPNLKELYVVDSSFRELFPIRTLVPEEKQTEDIVRLRQLCLWYLPRLESICIEGLQLDHVLDNLERLYVQGCPSLANLVPASASFNCLTFLGICACDGLRSLFSPSTAKGLFHLIDMSIEDCKMLQEIIATVDDQKEHEITFSHLESLKLACLPNLSSFCSGNSNFYFPCLEIIIVTQCLKMEIFSQREPRTPRLQCIYPEGEDYIFWEGDLNATIKKLYEDQVGFYRIEELNFDEHPILTEIWNGRNPEQSFGNLKSLIINKCDSLSYIVPSHLLSSLTNLEELEVSDCDSIEVAFDVQEINQMCALVPLSLKKMTLEHLPKLMHLWNKDPQQIISPHLQELHVEDNENLRSIFPLSIAKHLKQLQKFEILECGVEEIISKEGVAETDAALVFPELIWLKLWKLPNLRDLYHQKHKLECPKLRVLDVSQCSILTPHPLFLLDTVSKSQFRGDSVKSESSYEYDKSPIISNDLFSKVENLSLECFVKEPLTFTIITFYEQGVQCSSFQEIFPNLKSLKVSNCDGLINLVTSSTVRSFVQLTRLTIIECEMMEEIVIIDEEDTHKKIKFHKLEYLELTDLSNLKSFCSKNCTLEFPSLDEVIVKGCVSMDMFCPGILSTPLLENVIIEDDQECWEDGLNKTIRLLYKESSRRE